VLASTHARAVGAGGFFFAFPFFTPKTATSGRRSIRNPESRESERLAAHKSDSGRAGSFSWCWVFGRDHEVSERNKEQ
jgi:hypothetical protein